MLTEYNIKKPNQVYLKNAQRERERDLDLFSSC